MDKFGRGSVLLLLIWSLTIHAISAANNTINSTQSIRDGETLDSSGGKFELGFFSPGNSTKRFLGIWYKNTTVRTYVWVANRQEPLTSNSGVLRVIQPGILALFNHTNGTLVWSSNATRTVRNPAVQLLDSGNLVVKDDNDSRPESFLWQSFDYPSDTYLPGMMSLGLNLVTGVETYLSSWRSDDDPGPGEFTAHLDPTGYPQLLLKRGTAIQHRNGPWNGLRFSGSAAGRILYPKVRMNKDEVRYWDDIVDRSLDTSFRLSMNGVALRMMLNQRTDSWTIYRTMPADSCDNYNSCGPNGFCNIGSSPTCGCLDRFVPRDPESWTGLDRSKGCARRVPLNCEGDVFLKYSGIKMPDARNSTVDEGLRNLAECEEKCSTNCSCMAYTQLNISGTGSGCLFYHGDFIDIRIIPSSGQDLYIRMASVERVNAANSKGKNTVKLIASFASIGGVVLVCLSLAIFCMQKAKKERNIRKKGTFSGSDGKEGELQFFNLSTILKATDHFSTNNKLGEGGFGSVYKGILEGGQEIAVKRLSKLSLQGVDELKNEVMLIAKLQHRNLVKLLGCCIRGEENMLIYEYMPNNSLDLILFDQTKSTLLDWQNRLHIINGIAKGLLYLHEDSRLRIIHRDLKASNILLDADMNPKISDFGLARTFGGNENATKTRKVVGTYGYMSPEYAMDGLFSIKSDVFSFGVLLLEVVSGKRNRGFSLKDHNLNLIQHAWTLHREFNSVKLVDASLGDSFDLSQAMRSIHVGLLCVQKYPEDRPNMSSVVFMLGNEVELPQVKQPGFFTEEDVCAAPNSSSSDVAHSENQLTITMPVGR